MSDPLELLKARVERELLKSEKNEEGRFWSCGIGVKMKLPRDLMIDAADLMRHHERSNFLREVLLWIETAKRKHDEGKRQ